MSCSWAGGTTRPCSSWLCSLTPSSVHQGGARSRAGADPIPAEMEYRVGKGLEASADPLEILLSLCSMADLGPPKTEGLNCEGPSTFPEAQEGAQPAMVTLRKDSSALLGTLEGDFPLL